MGSARITRHLGAMEEFRVSFALLGKLGSTKGMRFSTRFARENSLGRLNAPVLTHAT